MSDPICDGRRPSGWCSRGDLQRAVSGRQRDEHVSGQRHRIFIAVDSNEPWRHWVSRSSHAATTPVRGAPNAVRFDGTTSWCWWGQDDHDEDRVLARAGRALPWDTAEQCRSAAEAAVSAFDPDQAGPEGGGVINLHPAQKWLRHRMLFLDTSSGLNLWNRAMDIAAGTGQGWNPRGLLVDRCYDKLVAADMPFLFDLESYRPQWTPRQLRALRQVLGSACHTIRSASA